MSLPIPGNHKFGLIALEGAADFDHTIDLGQGC
jgi:hypothetical protein